MQNVGFETLQEESAKFIEARNQRAKAYGDGHGVISPQAMEQLWREAAGKDAKQRRIEPMKQGRYFTRWRRFTRRSQGERPTCLFVAVRTYLV